MSAPLSRQEAFRLLGVAETADASTVKQAYRRLAREHHPDLGGDPDTFHRLRRAYERASSGEPAAPPTVSRGRPSRRPAPHTSDLERTDAGSVMWQDTVGDGEGPLDRDRLANLLADGGPEAVTRVVATSRAPGSHLNRIAAHLSSAFTSWLVIQAAKDDRGRALVAIEVTATGRRARRALDRTALDDVWTRTRRSSSTTLSSTFVPGEDRRTNAVRACDQLTPLLDRLGWPLVDWTTTAEGP